MKKYKVAQTCDQRLRELGAKKGASEKDALERERMVAVATAVELLSKLTHDETKEKLKDLLRSERTDETPLTLMQGSAFLSNRNPLFW